MDINNEVFASISLLRLQLSNLRKSKHVTQKELSDITGLSCNTISEIENLQSGTNFTINSIVRYLNGLGSELYIKPIDVEN